MASTVFERYGGFANISRVVSEFYDRVLESQVISGYFVNSDMRRLIDHQTKFIASLMGGPASYSNETLERIHSRLNVDERAFSEMASLLKETLEDFDFDESDISEVLGEIASRKRYIVTKKS